MGAKKVQGVLARAPIVAADVVDGFPGFLASLGVAKARRQALQIAAEAIDAVPEPGGKGVIDAPAKGAWPRLKSAEGHGVE